MRARSVTTSGEELLEVYFKLIATFLQQIRLHGGVNPKKGRVEVFHDGKWGSVCADGWGIEEAMTVCRQLNLGYAGQAVTKDRFGGKHLKVVMSGVNCRVDEFSLYNCQHDQWTNATCSSQDKLAGVVCVDGKMWIVQQDSIQPK